LSFWSILSPQGPFQEKREEPAFFSDLNLDQLVEAITHPKKDYDLKPYYYSTVPNKECIRYRQEVFRDLEDPNVMRHIVLFTMQMSRVTRYERMIEKLSFEHHRKGWFLEAVLAYCEAVRELEQGLSDGRVSSRGLGEFREYLGNYVHSPEFQLLFTEACEVKKALGGIKYSLVIHPGKFSVRAYEGELDYTVEIERTFQKFREGTVKQYVCGVRDNGGMNHIEAKILEFVARLHPEPFAALGQFFTRRNPFIDDVIRRFHREIQFYVAYLEFLDDFKRQGLPFCYPEVSALSKEEEVRDGFDLALAAALRQSKGIVVCNDFFLEGPERILVVTGPNQGGKTTFARMFGQLHYLAALGCPVPARKARLFICDRIFTHFEREESVSDLRGRLQNDLLRMRDILLNATPESVLIVNEIFASTTLEDAVFLSRHIMERVVDLGALCVWVTFIDELSCLGRETVSMVGTVDPDNPNVRTFKILRRPADGLAYALSIARKHRLTYQQIKERVEP
jgi:DNA mismatch repair protein MutS